MKVTPFVIACALPLGAQEPRVIDDFSSLAAWTSAPSDGVSLQLVPATGTIRMDVAFQGGGGYAVARRAVDLEVPENSEITFRVRGTIPPRPPEWNQWPEVVWRDQRIPRFFGDVPHGWVASAFIRSVLDLFAYEDQRQTGAALVIAGGVREEWLREGDGVRVRALPTRFGKLGYAMRPMGDTVTIAFDPGLHTPAAGVVVRNPFLVPPRRILVDGRETSASADGDLELFVVPREVRFEY